MPWSIPKKIWFRTCFIFFTLYIFFNPNGWLPGSYEASMTYLKPFMKMVTWIEAHIVGIKPVPINYGNGSGDTTYDAVIYIFILTLTLIGAAIWSLLDRRRQRYDKLLYWLTVLVRYYFAFTMFTYGLAKIFKTQMPDPSLYTLREPYGSSSPMGLAWNFMGFSRAYNYFMGIAELSGAFFVLFRRTVRLGAIIGLITCLNIVMINFCFDVCVKFLSSTLTLMCIYLLCTDWRRHTNFFLLNKHIIPHGNTAPVFNRRWKNITAIVFKWALILFTFIYGAVQNAGYAASDYYHPERLAYIGAYNVETFIRGRDTLAPLTTDTTRWRDMTLPWAGSARIRMMNDTTKGYFFNQDTVKHQVEMHTRADTVNKYYLSYAFVTHDSLVMKGKFKDDSIQVYMKRIPEQNYLLTSRGFHLINEAPFNR